MTVKFKKGFASNIVYIFFAQSILQGKYFRDQISIAMEKFAGNFTVGMFNDYKLIIECLVNKDQGFYFVNQKRGTPANSAFSCRLEMEGNTRNYFKTKKSEVDRKKCGWNELF